MQIQEVLMHLLLKQPFYGYFAASVVPVESESTDTMMMSLIPVPKLSYNRKWFEALSEEHAVGFLLHELLHLVLLHPFRKGNREENLWIIACDMAVNEQIHPSLLTREAVTVETIARELRQSIPKGCSAEVYYDILASDDNNHLSLIYDEKSVRVMLQSGLQLTAAKSPEGDSSQMNQNAVRSMLAEIVDQARMEGEIPEGLTGIVDDIYCKLDVNWRNILKRFLSGKGRVQITKSCKKLSRRFDDLPGNKRIAGATALLAIDESGSISDKQLAAFYNEMLSIRRITGATLHVVQFDTACTLPVPIEKYVRKKARIKSGGTDFRPVFTLADKMRIPLVIIFTDGEGTVPGEVPAQRVLWVLTKGGKQPAPYGHNIMYEE